MICALFCRFHSLGGILLSTFAERKERKKHSEMSHERKYMYDIISNSLKNHYNDIMNILCVVHLAKIDQIMANIWRFILIHLIWVNIKLTICLSRHFLLFTYFRQNSQIYTMDNDVNSCKQKSVLDTDHKIRGSTHFFISYIDNIN